MAVESPLIKVVPHIRSHSIQELRARLAQCLTVFPYGEFPHPEGEAPDLLFREHINVEAIALQHAQLLLTAQQEPALTLVAPDPHRPLLTHRLVKEETQVPRR